MEIETSNPEVIKAAKVIYKAVSYQLRAGLGEGFIVQSLKEAKFSEKDAIDIINEVKARMARARSSAIQMLISGAICIIGIIITVLSYNVASIQGGTYFFCWGAIIFGGIYFIINFFKWLSEK